jgi:hypothetical protein
MSEFAKDLPYYRELDQRHNDGIEVTMYWQVGTMAVTIAVEDAKTKQQHIVEVPDPSKAYHYFHHVMAYTEGGNETRNIYA